MIIRISYLDVFIHHYTRLTFVHPSVRDGTLPTFTGSRVVPEAFSLSHSGLEAASGLLCKATS